MVLKDDILPFYFKAGIFFIGISAFIAILYIAQSIIVPLIFALIISILLNPVVNFFTRIKIPRLLAITITLLIAILILVAFGAFLFSQLSMFGDSWPKLVQKFTLIIGQAVSSLSEKLEINPKNIYEWLANFQNEIINRGSAAIGRTLLSVGTTIALVLLVPVYIFLLLYYKPLLLEFIRKLFAERYKNEMDKIVSQTKTVIQHYLVGIIIETVIVAILNSAALMILGVQYAILIGILGALLNLIPYIGGLVAVAMPMMVALVTIESPWYPLYILIIYYLIQLFDNNYIVPVIVASKVKINALMSIIVVLTGNALWGIPGMFLSIPLLAIVKVIFDHIESLKPWGYLLGDTMPNPMEIHPKIKKDAKKPVSPDDSVQK